MNTSRNMLTLTLINDRYAFQFDTGVVAWTLQKKHAHRNLERTVLHLERYNSPLTPEHNRTRQYPAELLLLLLFLTRLKLLLDEGLYDSLRKKKTGRRYAFETRRAYSATTRSSNEDALTRSGCPQPAPQRSPGRRRCAHRTRR